MNVTWATLSAWAWAKNAEYGSSTVLSVAGPRTRNAFQASSPTRIASDNQRGIRIRPVGSPGPGVDGASARCPEAPAI